MNLATSWNEDVVLITSMGSTEISQVSGTKNPALAHVEVYDPSWGVVFPDQSTAVLTHPGSTHLSVLKRVGFTANFAYDHAIELGEAFRYSTEIISVLGSDTRVLVANRGRAPAGAPSWCHAVYEVDITTGTIVRTFETEREPRAMALSPDGEELFVGHILGSLGGSHLATNDPSPANSNQDGFIGDGGSILVYDMNAAGIVEPLAGRRIGVGSPVRGLVVTGNTDGSFVVYYTSVGDNSNSEDPEINDGPHRHFFGGRDIPNLINAAHYDNQHVLQELEHAVFNHHPDWTFADTNGDGTGDTYTGLVLDTDMPAVLPEKLIVRRVNSGGQLTRDLWVTNSGSGTLARTRLQADGHLQFETANGQVVMTAPLRAVHLWRSSSSPETISKTVDNGTSYPILADVGTKSFLDLSRSTGQSLRFTSDVRGICYAPISDKIWVATRLDNEVFKISGTNMSIATRLPVSDNAGASDERNFFGFGRGFSFRESGPPPISAPVGNQTCATCHVDGRLDGKVRLTRRQARNLINPLVDDPRKPVAVPSCFDVGSTEWIFFEGTRTITDGNKNPAPSQCNYCDETGFFDNTQAFTDVLSSPRSPHNWSGTLTASERRGRYLFEAMNCSRCHGGPIAGFLRTNESAAEFAPGKDANVTIMGPASGNGAIDLKTANPFLHDPSQSFITQIEVNGLTNDRLSHRNMTDVGTRPPGDGVRNGINTPALAGAWDNGPYMHDGRYRTLGEVLDHTWLFQDEEYRAAPLDPTMGAGTPDNAFNMLSFPITAPVPDDSTGALWSFGTHSDAAPTGVVTRSVSAYVGTDYQDLLAFLLSLSSQTDPCDGPDDFIYDLVVTHDTPEKITASWSTVFPTRCEVTWTHAATDTTPFGTSHSSEVGLPAGTTTVTVTALIRTVCGSQHKATEEYPSGGAPQTQRFNQFVTALGSSYPNPFNPETTIEFSLAHDTHVSLIVYDAAGARVRTLVDEDRAPDEYRVRWDGRNDNGAPVSSGIYFCRMVSGEYASSRKLILLK